MKIKLIYTAILIASGFAYILHASNIFRSEIKLSDLKLCEEAGSAFFLRKDQVEYQKIVNEIDSRRKKDNFTINSRSCGLFGLASVVNTSQVEEKQINLTLKSMFPYSQNTTTERR